MRSVWQPEPPSPPGPLAGSAWGWEPQISAGVTDGQRQRACGPDDGLRLLLEA